MKHVFRFSYKITSFRAEKTFSQMQKRLILHLLCDYLCIFVEILI